VGHVGTDVEALGRVGTFVELHVEQGRGLIDLGRAVAVASSIWPHGRWRLELDGEPTTPGRRNSLTATTRRSCSRS